MNSHRIEGTDPATRTDLRWMFLAWLAVCPIVFLVAGAVAYRPSLEGTAAIILASLPFVVFVATMTALAVPVLDMGPTVHLGSFGVAFGGWAVLMFQNSDWWYLTFVLLAVCFGLGPRLGLGPFLGVALAGALVVIWTIAWALDDELVIAVVFVPGAVFMVSSVIAVMIQRVEQTKEDQAALIEELVDTRRALAAAERTKGVLEERARFASEIHDTLTQGFTSIVLLARSAKRDNCADESWAVVETTAIENLEAARRLVAADRPPELSTVSLPKALERQLAVSLPTEVESEFQLVGQPRPLNAAVEVALLRAAQEAILNVAQHANAQRVHMTLSYLDDVIVLDVRDDGVGFATGEASPRGELTGGQGLEAMEARARSLDGEMTIEALEEGGSVLSILLPAVSQ